MKIQKYTVGLALLMVLGLSLSVLVQAKQRVLEVTQENDSLRQQVLAFQSVAVQTSSSTSSTLNVAPDLPPSLPLPPLPVTVRFSCDVVALCRDQEIL